MKKLVALYKAYRGGEWFEASLASIRPGCDGAVVVSSDKPWQRQGAGTEATALPENCRAPLRRFVQRHPGFPVTVVELGQRVNSEDQYRIGLAVIAAEHGADCGALLVDTDEVWEDETLGKVRAAMSTDNRSTYFRVGIWTYLRSPFYRVHPQEDSRVVVGLANPGVSTGNSRCSDLPQLLRGVQPRDVAGAIHHMAYTRLDPEEFVAKLSNTAGQDRVKSRPNWKQEVWDRLPKGRDIHPAVGFAKHWQGVRELRLDELPPEATCTDAFWACAAHHRGGIPLGPLLDDDPAWRARAETDSAGIATTVPPEHAVPLCAALGGRLSQERCVFLTPRLRMAFREVVQLAAHAAQVPNGGTVVEIGSGMGGSMALMAATNPHFRIRLHAVDPFVPYDEQNLDLVRDTNVGTVHQFFETMAGCGVEANLHQMSSAMAALQTWSPLDLVLVDGNHSYEHALHDLTAWWPKLRPGGTLLLHDCSGRFPGVVRAAKEFAERDLRIKFNLPLGSSLAWVKKS